MKGIMISAAAVLGLVFAGAVLAQDVRQAVWAGQFYDADKAALAARIDGYLASAQPASVPGKIRALIVPHAGYIYSGKTAAFAYKLVQGSGIETVVILGPSHRVGFEGCSIYTGGAFATPLGLAQIDAPAAQAIAKSSGFGFVPEAHAQEHSVEIQVPFIQEVLPQAKIVPIVMGFPSEQNIRILAAALGKVLKDRKALVVASTDMSHYLNQEEAAATDKATIELVRDQKVATLLRKIERNENVLCGGAGVVTALLYAQKAGPAAVTVLRYADSTEGGGPADGVVGYFSAAVSAAEPPSEFSLSSDGKKELLRLARQAVELFVKEGKLLDYEAKTPELLTAKGAFVTLKKDGDLRGCIGFIEPVYPLAKTVIQCAVYAAAEDPRFGPVKAAELRALEYEISVLTPLVKIDDPARVRVGKHGLVIASGGRRGLLLPQVPVENNWDRLEFLAQACVKAGLAPDAWRKGADIFVFEAIVFK